MLVCSYNNFNILAHKPAGEENKYNLTVIREKSLICHRYSRICVNPAFILKHPTKRIVYVCHESIYNGFISTFRYNKCCKELIYLNTVSSGGKSSCYLVFNKKYNQIININYWDSSISIHPIKLNWIQEPIYIYRPVVNNNLTSIEDHLENRQKTSHHHSCVINGDFLYVPDLGKDCIDIFRLHKHKIELIKIFNLPKGSGPRYLIINNHYLYVINELNSSIIVLKIISETELLIIQNISTIPKTFKEYNTCGSLVIHPNKKWIFASNRGHNSIASFEINPDSGKLLIKEIFLTEGKTPRHFCISENGNQLTVANQDSDTVNYFLIDNNGYTKSDNKIIYCKSPNFVIEL